MVVRKPEAYGAYFFPYRVKLKGNFADKKKEKGPKPQAPYKTPIKGEKTMKTHKSNTWSLRNFFRKARKNSRDVPRRPEWKKDIRVGRYIFLLK